ncbi:MAG: DUF2878 domain-containing protein [Myxococcaceae bacterium]|nr:DUF2878 domain-containing protein [Myxococcaceae bacterium]MCA3010955.1 DUF2878 domain-containing protein [Myxococcaceae bacterium]
MSPARKWLHAAGMQGAWFAAALSASTPWHLLGVAANGVVFAVHVGTSGATGRELVRGAVALALGLGVEVVNQRVGGLRVQQAATMPPAWLLSLWPVFASAMMTGHSLAWLRQKKAVAAALGAVVGPLSYSGGGRLGALELDGARSVLTLAVCWGLAMPALAWLADRLEPTRAPKP